MSWGRFHHAAGPSGMRTIGRCSRPKPAPRTVVVIDEDDDVDDGAADSEVFIIDGAAEKARAASGCKTKKGNSSCSNVINIDDEDDEEEGGGDRAGPSTACGAGSPAATTPLRGSPRNRYGLDYISDSYESDLSEGWNSDGDGSSDCEILDDTSGTARKLWENAASRKKVPHNPQECKDGRGTTSASSAESSTQQDENVENIFGAECHLNDDIWGYFNDVFKQGGPSSTSGSKYGTGPSSVPNAHGCPKVNVSNGKETGDCNVNSSLDPDTACNDETAHSHKGPVPEKGPERSQSSHLDETLKAGHASSSFVSANRVLPACSSVDLKDDSPIFVSTPEKMDEKIPEVTSSHAYRPDAHNEITKQNKETCFAPDDGSVIGQPAEDPPFTSRCGCLKQSGENCAQVQANSCACVAAPNNNASANVMSGNCSLAQEDLVDDTKKLGQSAMVQDAPDFQGGLIGEREKHKQSVEYKRAAEEEWASRQRQLLIQAEEAKRLRKRKKAEALRLLDMEKRQKQRLEEVRESQRKNEEAIQLKEQYRGVVRLELENMERRYSDMASILRVLGIPVEGGEVKAAYKQALLKFHPDRVSRSDIYQQVKAEETFKFISRQKEKLLRVF